MMKQTYKSGLKAALLCLATVSLLTACGKDADGFLPDVSVKELTVTTHVNGYLPEGAEAGSRASSSGNAFNFTAGDAIGLIALKNGSVVSEYNNVKLTYSGGGWRSSEPLYDFGATSYIAYYPYRSDMSGKTSVDAIKSAFPIKDDQSTEADFNASNLLTATATPNGESLRFNFTPAFAMVETTKTDGLEGYSNANGENFTYKFYSGNEFPFVYHPNGFFCASDNKTFRKIIKPSTATSIRIYVGFQNQFVANYDKTVTVSAGNYKKLVIKPLNYNLALGDYVYNMGGAIAFFPEIALNNSPKSNCIAVISKMGQGTGDNPSNYDGKLSAVHGYAVALKDAVSGTCLWASTDPKDQIGVGSSLSEEDYVGYSNTKKIKAVSGYSENTFPACWKACNYSVSAPSNSSGWYLPDIAQCYLWFNKKSELNTAFTKVGGVKFSESEYICYVSSTEVKASDHGISILRVRLWRAGWGALKAESECYVRSCLTF